MEARSNINGFTNRSQDWKENTDIIDTEPGKTQQEDSYKMGHILQKTEKKEIKADILEAIDNKGIQKRADIIHELEHDNKKILECLEELKTEEVLQVTDSDA